MIYATHKNTLRWQGEVYLWELSEEIEYEQGKFTDWVVTSAANIMFYGPETYIFPCNEDAEVLCWSELEGSYKGGLDHYKAIRNAGWIPCNV